MDLEPEKPKSAARFAQGALMATNTIFGLVAIILVIISGYAYSLMTHHGALNPAAATPAIGGMAVGLFGASLACCGFWGSVKALSTGEVHRKPWLLQVYMVGVFLLLLCQVGVIVAAALFRSDAEADIKDSLSDAWDESSSSNRKSIQDEFKCCGFLSPSDRAADPCPTKDGKSAVAGCWTDMRDQLASNLLVLEISAVVFGFIQILVLGLAFALSSVARSRRQSSSEPLLLYSGNDSVNTFENEPWYARRS